MQGSRIRVSVDGQNIVDVVDDDHAGQPALAAGGICLAARKWRGADGHTIVAFDDVRVTPSLRGEKGRQ